ncbi:MAG: hypothetical protein CL944_00835 [Candidatus Diapherotrites archaeon]|uniref:Dockerin domain-containing protein n=1 Tax=Candidatus Iainarchaeum sp. TaxID=3101447 RepID=A0A2D6LP94_9ARCH|nr:hypothetical protein [Candidatus Diapherotrites archaeon]
MGSKGFSIIELVIGIIAVIAVVAVVATIADVLFNSSDSGDGTVTTEPPVIDSDSGAVVGELCSDQLHLIGDSPWPAGDGCNTCSCGSDGSITCTKIACGGFPDSDPLPKVKYKWNWQDIAADSCDADVSDAIFCDSTQFTIALLKSINDFQNTGSAKSRSSFSGFEFEANLMKSGFSDDFRKDFDQYYQSSFFADLGTPTFYNNSDGLWQYFYDSSNDGRFVFQNNGQPWTSGMSLEPGVYTVTVTIPGTFNLSSPQDDPIEVNFEFVSAPARDSVLYYLPFNAELGLRSASGKIDRIGYGVGFSGTDTEDIPINSLVNFDVSELKLSDGIVRLSKAETRTSLVELNDPINLVKRGELLKISRGTNNNSYNLKFSPSIPNPVLFKVTRPEGSPGSFPIFYTVYDGSSLFEFEPQPQSFINWTTTSNSCRDFTGVLLTALYGEGVFDTVANSTQIPDESTRNSTFGFSWNNVSALGNVTLESVVYAHSSDRSIQVDFSNDNPQPTDPFGTFVSIGDSGIASGNTFSLNGTYNKLLDNTTKSLADVFALVEAGYVNVIETDDSITFVWNQNKILELVDASRQELFNECILAVAQETNPPAVTLTAVPVSGVVPLDVKFEVACSDAEDDADTVNDYPAQFCRIDFGAHVEVVEGNLADADEVGDSITWFRFPWHINNDKWVTVRYSEPGTFTAKGTAKDKDGNEVETTKTITVTQENIPPTSGRLLSSSVFVDTIADGSTTGIGYVEVTKGTDVIELYDGQVYPFGSASTGEPIPYKVKIVPASNNPNALYAIQVKAFDEEWIDSEDGLPDYGPLSVGDTANFLQSLSIGTLGKDFVNIEFLGFNGNGSQEGDDVEIVVYGQQVIREITGAEILTLENGASGITDSGVTVSVQSVSGGSCVVNGSVATIDLSDLEAYLLVNGDEFVNNLLVGETRITASGTRVTFESISGGSCGVAGGGIAVLDLSDIELDITIGGELNFGAGAKVYRSALNSSPGSVEVGAGLTSNSALTDAQLPHLFNNAITQRVNPNATSLVTRERIGVEVDAFLEGGELIATIDGGNFSGLAYETTLGSPETGLDLGTTHFVDDSIDNVTIILFGEQYKLAEARLTAPRYVRLVKSSSRETYKVGETIQGLVGAGLIAGQDVSINVTQVEAIDETATEFEATFELFYTPAGDNRLIFVESQKVGSGVNLRDVFGIVPPNQRINLLSNPGFEEGSLGTGNSNAGSNGAIITDWVGVDCPNCAGDFFWDTSVKHSGINSVKLTTDGSKNYNIVLQGNDPLAPLEQGETYKLTGWMKSNLSSGQCTMDVVKWDNGALELTSGISALRPTISGIMGWTNYSMDFTIPQGVTQTQFRVIQRPRGSANPVGDCWFDDMRLVKGVPEVSEKLITFTVFDASNNFTQLSGVTVRILQDSVLVIEGTTDLQGEALFELEMGEYEFVVSKSGYDSQGDSFTVANLSHTFAISLVEVSGETLTLAVGESVTTDSGISVRFDGVDSYVCSTFSFACVEEPVDVVVRLTTSIDSDIEALFIGLNETITTDSGVTVSFDSSTAVCGGVLGFLCGVNPAEMSIDVTVSSEALPVFCGDIPVSSCDVAGNVVTCVGGQYARGDATFSEAEACVSQWDQSNPSAADQQRVTDLLACLLDYNAGTIDLLALLRCISVFNTPLCDLPGDIDGDGEITCGDVSLIAERWQTGGYYSCLDSDNSGVLGINEAIGGISNLIDEHNLDCGETASVNLQEGWNLISIPVVDGLSVSDLQSKCDIASSIWAWDAAYGRYEQEGTKLEAGKGYFVKANESCTFIISGTPFSFEGFSIPRGLSLIGSTTVSVNVSDILGTCPLDTEFYLYAPLTDPLNSASSVPTAKSSTDEVYIQTTTLSPSKGYWVKNNSDEACSLAAGESACDLPGDIDGDGSVTCDDYDLIEELWNSEVDPASCVDSNDDGVVNIFDWLAFIDNVPAGLDCSVPQVSCLDGQRIGDVDRDGKVNITDSLLASHITTGLVASPSNICCVDVTQDGVINHDDVDEIVNIAVGNAESPGTCDEEVVVSGETLTLAVGQTATTDSGISVTFDSVDSYVCSSADFACVEEPVDVVVNLTIVDDSEAETITVSTNAIAETDSGITVEIDNYSAVCGGVLGFLCGVNPAEMSIDITVSSEELTVSVSPPGKPTWFGVAPAENIDGAVRVTWNPVVGADFYNLYRHNSVTGVTESEPFLDDYVGTVSATYGTISYFDRDLSSGSYCYRVTAENAGGESGVATNTVGGAGDCATVEGVPQVTAPGFPSWYGAAAVDAGTIRITWNTDRGGETFNLYRVNPSTVVGEIDPQRDEISSSPFVTDLFGSGDIINYFDEGLAAGTYCYTVTGVNSGGESAFAFNTQDGSGPCATVEGVPQVTAPGFPSWYGVAPAENRENTVRITWNPVSSADFYNLYRHDSVTGVTESEPFLDDYVGTISEIYGTITYLEENLSAGTYCYRVTAENAGGESGVATNTVGGAGECATLESTELPVAPTELSAVANNNGFIDLSWIASEGATSYDIYDAGNKIGSSSSISYEDDSLTDYVEHCYEVKAVNSAGASASFSNEACATPLEE